jgi:hypothetical protein
LCGDTSTNVPKEVTVLREWLGEAGPGADKSAPQVVIRNRDEYVKACSEFGLEKHPLEIDFSKEFAVIATSRGSRISFRSREEGEGRLKVMSISTRDIRPGLRVGIGVFSRQGVVFVNDTKL